MSDYSQFPDLEIVELRKKVRELEQKLAQAQAVLRENDLLDAKVSLNEVEEMCIRELKRYNELSKKGGGLTLEDNKNIDILHKNLLLSRGKSTDQGESKAGKKKKESKPDIGELLSIVSGGSDAE